LFNIKKKIFYQTVIAITCLLASVRLYAQTPVNGFVIEKETKLQVYNPMIFGQLLEYWLDLRLLNNNSSNR
jgi:hypothetical protein